MKIGVIADIVGFQELPSLNYRRDQRVAVEITFRTPDGQEFKLEGVLPEEWRKVIWQRFAGRDDSAVVLELRHAVESAPIHQAGGAGL